MKYAVKRGCDEMDAAKKMNYSTIEDIYNLPDGQRAELIEGKLYMMATPGMKHQRLVMILSNIIFNYIQNNKGRCEVFSSPLLYF